MNTSHYFYRPQNEVWGKVMFSFACVILFTGGGPCPGVSVWGVSVQRGLCSGGLCPGGSLSRGVSVQGISVGGVSVRETPVR